MDKYGVSVSHSCSLLLNYPNRPSFAIKSKSHRIQETHIWSIQGLPPRSLSTDVGCSSQLSIDKGLHSQWMPSLLQTSSGQDAWLFPVPVESAKARSQPSWSLSQRLGSPSHPWLSSIYFLFFFDFSFSFHQDSLSHLLWPSSLSLLLSLLFSPWPLPWQWPCVVFSPDPEEKDQDDSVCEMAGLLPFEVQATIRAMTWEYSGIFWIYLAYFCICLAFPGYKIKINQSSQPIQALLKDCPSKWFKFTVTYWYCMHLQYMTIHYNTDKATLCAATWSILPRESHCNCGVRSW